MKDLGASKVITPVIVLELALYCLLEIVATKSSDAMAATSNIDFAFFMVKLTFTLFPYLIESDSGASIFIDGYLGMEIFAPPCTENST